ncbi:hypothetical protein EBZ80_21425 [bacterium]|nr:hypothetical protein [Betaproteobacteria bacterium]NDE17487.1 hypothetical protein [bacterium]
MYNNNMDFGGFIDDENPYEDENAEEGYEEYLTVEALLCVKFGDQRGAKIYRVLKKYATRAAQELDGGEPGLLFNDEGGEFVSFTDSVAENG